VACGVTQLGLMAVAACGVTHDQKAVAAEADVLAKLRSLRQYPSPVRH